MLVARLAQNRRPVAAASGSIPSVDNSVTDDANDSDVRNNATDARTADDHLKDLVLKLIDQNKGLTAAVEKMAAQIEELSSSVHQRQHPTNISH